MRFVEMTNSRSAGELLNPVRQIRNLLERLDGTRLSTFLVHSVPDDFDIADEDPRKHASEYLQCAGSNVRMVLEVRRREGDGFVQYAVARSGLEARGLRVEVAWADHRVVAFERELFTAEQAVDVFEQYVVNEGALPPDVPLRRLDLD